MMSSNYRRFKERLEETKELKQVIEINREALIRKTSMHESSHAKSKKIMKAVRKS
jgi:hypothetical protein